MRRIFLAVSVTIFALQSAGVATNLEFKPTTTLAAQTSNNTSAVDQFASQANGNLAAGNVSKLDIHSLLYPGATTKIYAHFMLWFGGSNHMNVGYSSTDSKQITRQIQDMISRGIDGVIIDWYGGGSTSDRASLLVMKEAEAHPGFTFAIMVDAGAIRNNSCTGCTPQQALNQHLRYIEQTYFGSPAYMRVDGRPVVTNFDVDTSFKVDWQIANAAIASNPVFVFQNSGGFSHAMSDGGYSWVQPSTTDFGAKYLTSFYQTGKSYAQMQTVGATYKGFNDKLAAWGSNRVMQQQCGQTWLQTFSRINSLYNAGSQLDSLQLVTWNDYEEGTEIESGIDNCVSVAPYVSGSSLNWKTTGNENTIDHYKIYISLDGRSLMPLIDMATGLRSIDLCSFSLDPVKYRLFVQAVGKPSMRNQISTAVNYTPQCGGGTNVPNMGGNGSITNEGSGSGTTAATPPVTPPPSAPPQLSLQAAPASLKIAAGKSGTTMVSVNTTSGSLNVPIGFVCLNLPVGMTCSFSPVLASSSGAMTSTLSISVMPVAAFNRGEHHQGLIYTSLFAFGLMGFISIGQVNRKRAIQTFMVLALVGTTFFVTSCASVYPGKIQAGSSYTITVMGTSGDTQMSTDVAIGIE
jgi:hypothetical protein